MEKDILKKKKITTIIYYIVYFVLGFDNSCIAISVIYYFEEDLEVSNPKEYGSLVMGIFAASLSITGVIVGRYTDVTRRVKGTLLVLAMLAIIGNLMYTIHSTACWIFVGRALCGCFDSGSVIIIGEVSKCYNQLEMGSVMYKLQLFYTIGYTLGPVTAALFTGIHFSIGAWKITPYNFIGVFMAIVISIMAVVIFFTVDDISKEYQKESGSQSKNSMTCTTLQINKKNQYQLLSIFDILTDPYMMLVIILSSYLSYHGGSAEMLVNMTALFLFNMSLKTIGIVVTISAFCVLVLMCIKPLNDWFSKPENTVGAFIVCVFGICISCWIQVLPALIEISELGIQYTILISIMVLSSFSSISECTFAVQLLFRLVPENSSNFTAGVHNAMARIFLVVGYVNAGFTFPVMEFVLPSIIILILTMEFVFFWKRHVYENLHPSLEKYEKKKHNQM